jgi:glycosyltransferase involved in cell wall biosynthesis
MAQGLEIILKAAEILQENKEVFFLLVGDGPEKKALQDVAEKNRLRNIAFLPSQPKDKVADFYQAADVCLVPLKAVEFLGKFIPSKMFEIMACGRPMIASLAGEAQEIINKSGAGIVAPPGNFSKLAEAIIYMLNHEDKRSEMAEAGKRFVETNYNREQLALTYLKSLNLAQAKTR